VRAVAGERRAMHRVCGSAAEERKEIERGGKRKKEKEK